MNPTQTKSQSHCVHHVTAPLSASVWSAQSSTGEHRSLCLSTSTLGSSPEGRNSLLTSPAVKASARCWHFGSGMWLNVGAAGKKPCLVCFIERFGRVVWKMWSLSSQNKNSVPAAFSPPRTWVHTAPDCYNFRAGSAVLKWRALSGMAAKTGESHPSSGSFEHSNSKKKIKSFETLSKSLADISM